MNINKGLEKKKDSPNNTGLISNLFNYIYNI